MLHKFNVPTAALCHSGNPGDIPGVSWSRSQLTSVSEYSLCFETSKIASCLRGSPASPAHGNLPSANFENSPSANFAKPIAKRSVLVLQGGKEGGKEGEGGKQGAQYLCFLSLSRAWAFQQRWLPLRRGRLPPPILLVQALAMPSGWLPMTSPTQPLHETSSYRISGVSPDHCHACNLRSFAAKMAASILRTTTYS